MAKPAARQPRLVRLHLQLRHITDPIWRRLLIHDDLTLWHLHYAIQIIMGWDDYHLHSFAIAKRLYMPEGVEDCYPDGAPPVDEATVAIGDVLKRKGQKFVYTYDYGDTWEVDGVVEAVLPPDPAIDRPICLDGRRAGPLEDSGGPWMYQSITETMKAGGNADDDPDSYIDYDFDPEAFDRESVNGELAQLRRPTAAMTSDRCDGPCGDGEDEDDEEAQ